MAWRAPALDALQARPGELVPHADLARGLKELGDDVSSRLRMVRAAPAPARLPQLWPWALLAATAGSAHFGSRREGTLAVCSTAPSSLPECKACHNSTSASVLSQQRH